jgi:phosphate transport system substrate-binding protein
MSSRELHPEESAGIVQTVVARDGIAVIVHARNPVREMTLAQLRAIYAGEIRSWSELGGDDLPITVITREEGSGTRDTFEERVMGSATQISPTALVTAYSGGLRKMVAEDPRAIGYVTFSQINDQVRAVAVDGVMPTDATITSGRYLLQRPFLLLSRGTPTGEADDFLRFILSTEGQAMARADGLAPVEVH